MAGRSQSQANADRAYNLSYKRYLKSGSGGSGSSSKFSPSTGVPKAYPASTPIAIVRKYAEKFGLDPVAMVAYALTQGGTSWGAIGDNGSSFGPFQAHIGGVAGPRTPEAAAAWANSEQGLMEMMRMMARAGAKGLAGPDAAAARTRCNGSGSGRTTPQP